MEGGGGGKCWFIRPASCLLYESIFTVDVSPELAVGIDNCTTLDQQPPVVITLDNLALIVHA